MFAKAINAIQQNFGYNRLRAFGGRVLPRLPFSVFCRFPFVQKADLTKEPFVKIEKSLFETACLPSRLPLVFCLVLRVVCKKRFTSKKGLRKCVTGALQLFFSTLSKARLSKSICLSTKQNSAALRRQTFFSIYVSKKTPLRRVVLLLQSVFVLCIGLRLRNFCFAQK